MDTRAAIAVLFPEPDSELEFNLILGRLRKEFQGTSPIRVVAAVRGAADRIESILDSDPEEFSGDITIIGQDCITDGDVISYKGQNYYRACDIWVTRVEEEGVTFCIKKSGHVGHTHEDVDGVTRDATDDETPDPEEGG